MENITQNPNPPQPNPKPKRKLFQRKRTLVKSPEKLAGEKLNEALKIQDNASTLLVFPEYERGLKRIKDGVYTDPDRLQQHIDEYFEVYSGISLVFDENGKPFYNKNGQPITQIKPPTLSGLALHLEFASVQSLTEYADRPDVMSVIIKKAMLKVEKFVETMLFTSKPVGAIFWLKSRGWKEDNTLNVTNTALEGFLASIYNDQKSSPARTIESANIQEIEDDENDNENDTEN